ncbi:MAG: DUF2079 domain-containing protein [Polyangiaceae bacterium]
MASEPGELSREVGQRMETRASGVPALLALLAVGQSLCLMVVGFRLPPATRVAFFFTNSLPLDGPSLPGGTLLGALPFAVGLALVVLRGARGVAVVQKAARITAPLALAFVMPALFTWQLGQQRPIAYLILLAAFGLSTERLLRVSFEELAALGAPSFVPRLWDHAVWVFPRASRALPMAVVCLLSASYASYMGFFTIRHHHLIQTTAYDLGIFDNLLFNTIKGRFFESPVMFGPGHHNSLSTHAEYAMVLFAPIYALAPRAETLLLIQSFFLGAAAIPLYLFARTMLSALSSVVLAAAYLLFAPLHGPQFYDFHWLPICVFFYFWLFWALATNKKWLAVLMVLLLFALREDIAVGLALLGTFLFLTGTRARFGIGLAAASAVWFVIDKFIIMPWAGPWWFDTLYVDLFADGKPGYGNVVKTLISNPFYALSTMIRGPKLAYVLHMLAPVVLLPLRRLPFWLLLLPGSVFTLMTTGYWPTLSIAFQYTTHWVPFVFGTTVLAVFALRRGAKGNVRVASVLGALVLCTLSDSYNFGAILQRESFTGGFGKVTFEMSDSARERYEDLRSVVRKIPEEASVAATEYLNPHISSRKEAYVFRYDVGPVDYILLSDDEVAGDLRNTLNAKFSKEPYGLFAKGKHEFFLFKRGYKSPETADALRHLSIRVQPGHGG